MKRFFLLLIISFVFHSAQAQFQWQWANKGQLAASSSTDVVQPLGIAKDNTGSTYVIGTIQSASITFGSYVLTNPGSGINGFIFLVKYNAAGNLLWAKKFGNTTNSWGYDIAIDPVCNLYITGMFWGVPFSFGNVTVTSYAFDGYLVKLDSSGNGLWGTQLGGMGTDRGMKVNLDSQQNVYVSGVFSSNNFTVGSYVFSSLGDFDFFVAKYDSAGHALWARKGGGNQWDDVVAMDVDASGNCAVLGTFQSDSIMIGSNVLYKNSTYADIFVSRYDSAGNVLWARRESGSFNNRPRSIAIDGSGNTYFAGVFRDSAYVMGNDTLINYYPNTMDSYLSKYSISGNPIWAISFGAEHDDRVEEITKDNSNNIIVPGRYFSGSLNFGNNVTVTNSDSGSAEIFTVIFDSLGNAISAGTTSNSGYNGMGFSAVYPNNNSFDFISVGSFGPNPSSVNLGPLTLNATQRSMFVGRANGLLTGITSSSDLPGKILLYPNPVADELSVFGYALSEKKEITLYNTMGEKVLTRPQTTNHEPQTINVSSLAPGIYFVKIFSGEKIFTRKIIKM